MPSDYFSRFVYFDTNILSELAKHPEHWQAVFRYLTREKLTVAITDQVAELSDVHRLHASLSRMLVLLPSAVIKSAHAVLTEEVTAHPATRSDSLLVYPLNALAFEPKGSRLFEELLGSKNLRDARLGQRRAALAMPRRIAELKGNFPPSRNGFYTREQAPAFAFAVTVQWLAETHLSFMQQFHANLEAFKEEAFKSLRLFASLLYYKYYLGNREPTSPSDFGDLFHLYALPYCAVAVVERDLANVLAQIRRHDKVLDGTDVRNITFIRDLANCTETG
jgi:hypothetical protein